MKQKWETPGYYSVEIWFPVEKDKDGYPTSKNWEQLLARPLLERDDYFQIESIPFFLKNVSLGDIVRARTVTNSEIDEGEVFEFDTVLDRGGHNTYRLLLKKKHPDDPQFTENELLKRGLEDGDGGRGQEDGDRRDVSAFLEKCPSRINAIFRRPAPDHPRPSRSSVLEAGLPSVLLSPFFSIA